MISKYIKIAAVAVALAMGADAAPATGSRKTANLPEWVKQADTPQEQVIQGICRLLGLGVRKDEEAAAATLRAAAEQGYAPAQYLLAMLYYSGTGVPTDAAEQYRWSRAAAEQGYATGQYALGLCYTKGLGVEKNPEEALKWYLMAAEQGSLRAQYNVANAYRRGLGVQKNMEEALKWYRRAAEQGDTYSQNSLGSILFNGKEAKANLKEAAKWYRLAAEQGHAGSCYNYGLCLEYGKGMERNHPQAAFWYKAGADKGNKKACGRLGIFLTYGTTGVDMNTTLGLRYLHIAADLGDPTGFNSLGASYEKGRGAPVCLPYAFEQYKRSAELGNGEGMYNLARCYRYGKGVKRDYNKAMEWYLKAHEEGSHYRAAGCIGYMYLKGMGVEKNIDEAIKWMRRGVERGHNSAFRHLGRMYANGWGTDKNEERAAYLHKKLADGFNYDGLYEMGRNHYLGIGVEKDLQKAIKYWQDSVLMNCGDASCCLGLLRVFGIDGPADEQKGLELIEKGETSVTARYNIGMCYESGFGRQQDLRKAVRYYLRATRSENPCPQAIAALRRLGVQLAEERDEEGYAFTITHPEAVLSADKVKDMLIWPTDIFLTEGGMTDDWIAMQPEKEEEEEEAGPAPEPRPEATAADVARAKLQLASDILLLGDVSTALHLYQSAEKQGSTLSLDCQALISIFNAERESDIEHADALLHRAVLLRDFYAPAIITALQELRSSTPRPAAAQAARHIAH